MNSASEHDFPALMFRRAAEAARRSVSVGALLALLAGLLQAAEQRPLAEHQIEALYLFNFVKYVDWPAEAFGTTNAPYTIGVLDSGEIHEDLLEITLGKRVNGREVLVRRFERVEDARGCHVLFFGAARGPRLRESLQQLRTAPTLTVGKADDFLAEGGAIRFVRQQDKLRLEINVEATQRARLAVSAKLLGLARGFKGTPGKPPS